MATAAVANLSPARGVPSSAYDKTGIPTNARLPRKALCDRAPCELLGNLIAADTTHPAIATTKLAINNTAAIPTLSGPLSPFFAANRNNDAGSRTQKTSRFIPPIASPPTNPARANPTPSRTIRRIGARVSTTGMSPLKYPQPPRESNVH